MAVRTWSCSGLIFRRCSLCRLFFIILRTLLKIWQFEIQWFHKCNESFPKNRNIPYFMVTQKRDFVNSFLGKTAHTPDFRIFFCTKMPHFAKAAGFSENNRKNILTSFLSYGMIKKPLGFRNHSKKRVFVLLKQRVFRKRQVL